MQCKWCCQFCQTGACRFIALPRLVIAVVVLYVGANFLAITNNLQDLVLNSTALGFLIEVDNMIHSSLLGQSFEILVMHRFEAVSAPSRERGVVQSFGALTPCHGLLHCLHLLPAIRIASGRLGCPMLVPPGG